MASKFGFAKKNTHMDLKIEMSPMIDCVFQLLIFFIVTLQMDPSLDDVMNLPDAYKSARQEELNMEIYILPAGKYVDGSGKMLDIDWLTEDGSLKADEGVDYSGQIAFASKGNFDSMFVALDDVPYMIDKEREEKATQLIRHTNVQRTQKGQMLLTKAEEKQLKYSMALLIKADKDVFYARVLQVVEKAKEAGVSTFAFVSDVRSSILMDKTKDQKK